MFMQRLWWVSGLLVAFASASGCLVLDGDASDDDDSSDGNDNDGDDNDGGTDDGGAGGVGGGVSNNGGGGAGGGTPGGCDANAAECSTVMEGWSASEQEQWADLQTELDQHVALMNSHCGTAIVGKFAYETFRGHLEGAPFVSIMNGGVFEVQQICLDSQAGVERVSSNIDTIVMVYAGGSRSHTLQQGTLAIVLDEEPTPLAWQDAFADWLGSTL